MLIINKRKRRIWWNKTKPWAKRVAILIGINIIIWGNLGIEVKLAADREIQLQDYTYINIEHKEKEQPVSTKEIKETKKTTASEPQIKAATAKIELAKLDMTNDDGRVYLKQYATTKGMSEAQIQLMAKIIQAESGWEHYCKKVKAGCAHVGAVKTNPTKDFGYGQINAPYHLAKSKKMGLDIMDSKDNLKYTVYLFEHSSCTTKPSKEYCPWTASKHRANGTGWAD